MEEKLVDCMDEWGVEFCDEFDLEFEELNEDVKCSLIQHLNLLKIYGPQLPRPYADTLNGSTYPNMKELRFNADKGVWRVAFAFDPTRHTCLPYQKRSSFILPCLLPLRVSTIGLPRSGP